MTTSELRTRLATPADAADCRAVYAPYVEGSVISFEQETPSESEMADRIAETLRTHAWVVLEETAAGHAGEPRVVGYAYGGPHRSRAAYRWACEVSVYVEPGRRRTGAGRALYLDLFERLADRGYLTVLAGMTLPNPASRGLHRSLGFTDVGTWRRIGWKHDAWHDVHWVQRHLRPEPGEEPGDETGPPPELR